MVIQATYQRNVPIWKVPAIHSKDSSGSIFARKRTFQDISEDLSPGCLRQYCLGTPRQFNTDIALVRSSYSDV